MVLRARFCKLTIRWQLTMSLRFEVARSFFSFESTLQYFAKHLTKGKYILSIDSANGHIASRHQATDCTNVDFSSVTPSDIRLLRIDWYLGTNEIMDTGGTIPWPALLLPLHPRRLMSIGTAWMKTTLNWRHRCMTVYYNIIYKYM